MTSRIQRGLAAFALALALVVLAGCSKPVPAPTGDYRNDAGSLSVHFSTTSQLDLGVVSKLRRCSYTLDGDTLTITTTDDRNPHLKIDAQIQDGGRSIAFKHATTTEGKDADMTAVLHKVLD